MELFNNEDHSKYAYVTYEDLQKLPLWKKSSNQDGIPGQEDQSLVIAIQTPHRSLIKVQKERRKTMDCERIFDSQIEPDYNLDLYTLEIDAETGRQDLPDEKITIYQVEAPDQVKKGQ